MIVYVYDENKKTFCFFFTVIIKYNIFDYKYYSIYYSNIIIIIIKANLICIDFSLHFVAGNNWINT